ncbi:MAG: periplasmic heavy metal sensor [Opitutales bacterium]
MSTESLNKKKAVVAVALVAGLVLISVIVSIVTTHLMQGDQDWSHHDGENGHHWLHTTLELSAAEAAAVDAVEPAYRTQKSALQAQFDAKTEALRKLILESDELTAELKHAIHELHIVHGQLQELSIQHYYDMMDALPEDKQVRLREIAVKALSVPQ